MAGLTASPLGPTQGFNWIYLIELLITGILGLFFLFYFNRLFATIVSYAIRAYTWHKYKAYIDITALQISLLGGRIFFKSIRYHAHNITVLVHDGHVTWRYWLRQVQEAEVFEEKTSKSKPMNEKTQQSDGTSQDHNQDEVETGQKRKKELPCRISVKISGVEAFLYNRSPSYDGIVEAMLKKSQQQGARDEHSSMTSDHSPTNKESAGGSVVRRSTTNDSAGAHADNVPQWLRILPIHIQCKKAAAAVGNEHTTSIITAKVEHSSGQIDASAAGTYDLYKLLFQFEFRKVMVAMKPNRDYKCSQSTAAQVLLRKDVDHDIIPKHSKLSPLNLWNKLSRLFKQQAKASSIRTSSTASAHDPSPSHQIPGQAEWHGLRRYLTDDIPDDRAEWRDIEYAKASTLADCEQVDMKFYWDIPGLVPGDVSNNHTSLLDSYELKSVTTLPPPDYGIDLTVHGGLITYGPWADRQRVNLQKVFFPASFVDAVPIDLPSTGQTRLATVFKLFMLIEKDVTLRLPTRETSKDHRWQGRASKGPYNKSAENDKNLRNRKKSKSRSNNTTTTSSADSRPYGWVDVTVKPDSTVSYTMDMYPRDTGFSNEIDLDIKAVEIFSSVNHSLLCRSGTLTLTGDLSNPLSWNTLRDWPFKIGCNNMELFILRDHLFLIIDLVNDWGSGPPPDFYTFIPFRYTMDITLRTFVMYLNTNDANIINDASDLESNDFLTLEGEVLHGVLGIPLLNFRPKRNEITFDVNAQHMSMRMLSSMRNTMSTLLHDKRLAKLPKLKLLGSFESNQEQLPGLTDTLRMDIEGEGFSMQAYGFYLRHLINIKENYFGDFVHFKTLEEFQQAGDTIVEAYEQTASLPKPKSINELDVLLSIVVKEAQIMLPVNLYNAKQFVLAKVPEALVDLRVGSYYLDLAINLSPVSIQTGFTKLEHNQPVTTSTDTQLYISHTSVYGHRAFGAPPNEATYASTWEIEVGSVTGELKENILHDFKHAATALLYTFKDRDNALPLDSPLTIFDATFVQVRIGIVRIWLHIHDAALLLSANPITVHSNDWADEAFSQHVNVVVPDLTIACVERPLAARQHEIDKLSLKTLAFLQTSIVLNVVGRKRSFIAEAHKQQAYIRHNDLRTHRVPFLYRRGSFWEGVELHEPESIDPPAMIYPPFPMPVGHHNSLRNDASSIKSITVFSRQHNISRRSSSSSLATSVRQARLTVPTAFHTQRESSTSTTTHSSAKSVQTSSTSPRAVSIGRVPGMAPGKIAMSSPYAAPNFPLQQFCPDESSVPAYIKVNEATDSSSTTSTESMLSETTLVEDDVEQLTIMIQLLPGIRAYITPEVTKVAVDMVKSIQAISAEDVMDGFQVDVMSSVHEQHKARSTTSEVTQISISLPAMIVRAHNTMEAASDVLDVTTRSLSVLMRLRTASEQTKSEALSMHITLERIQAVLYEQLSSSRAVFQLDFDNLMLWLALAELRSIRLTVSSTVLNIDSAAAVFFLKLADRAQVIVKRIQHDFTTCQARDKDRLQLLLYQLTQLGEHVGDPIFLTKMVYILRAFPDHFRNQESWKVLMRFRNILQSLPTAVLDDLEHTFQDQELSCPDNAAEKMLESWTQWRNWDVINIEKTIAFRKIMGLPEAVDGQEVRQAPICLTWIQEHFKIGLAHQTKESHIQFSDLNFGIDVEPPLLPTGLMLVDENKRTRTLTHLHASSIDIDLKWSLIEITSELLPRILQMIPANDELVYKRSTAQALEDEIIRQEFHLVLSTDTGIITLHTINLEHVARAEGLRLSLIGTTQANEPYGVCASALLNADRTGTELLAHDKLIWQSLLISPSIYIDHLQMRQGDDSPPTMNVAVAYKQVQLNVIDQIPGILRVVDAVVADEVKQILQMVQIVEKHQKDDHKPLQVLQQSISGTEQPAKIHVAVLAGDLTVEMSLLHSLKYRLVGTAASIRVAPSLTEAEQMSIDFETGQLQHSLINISHSEEHAQHIVDVPPISGHVVLTTSATAQKASVVTTIGRLDVYAEALQAVATTLNRKEVQSVITAIKDGVEDIRERVDGLQLGGTRKENTSSSVTIPLEYDIRMSLAGVRVAANTAPGKSRATAAFELGIGSCNAVIDNKASLAGDIPLFPEIRAMLSEIGARLTIQEGKTVYPAGNITLTLLLNLSADQEKRGSLARELAIRSQGFEVNVYPETAAIIVDVINQLQDRLKHLDLSDEVDYLRSLRHRRGSEKVKIAAEPVQSLSSSLTAADLLAMRVKVDLTDVEMAWLVHDTKANMNTTVEDLVLTLAAIRLDTNGMKEGKLTINDLQLQLVPRGEDKRRRALNSILLPEIAFSLAYWSQEKDRHLAFKATGKPVDVRLDSRFVVPVAGLKQSIDYAIEKFRAGTADWRSIPTTSGLPRQNMLGDNHFASLTAEAEFAGAQVYLRGSAHTNEFGSYTAAAQSIGTQHGRYGQFAAEDGIIQTTLRSPGISLKLRYDNKDTSTVQAEMLVASSTNLLLPNVVPLVLEITRSVKDVMQNQNLPEVMKQSQDSTKLSQSTFLDEALATADPTAIFGKTKINFGLRIARQEFGLTCQPIAKIDAKAELDDFYLTISTIDSAELGHFFTVSASLSKLSTKVKHVYSREPTFSFEMDSIVLSLMNNKHFSGVNGISAILKINPTKTIISGKQLQDLLLFREIWLPPEIRNAAASSPQSFEPTDILMHRYQLVANAAAFPWHATVLISELAIDFDLGQSLGKTSFSINNLWASSQKNSNSEQNLCIGLDEIAINSQGRMSGYILLNKLAVRTLIMWPEQSSPTIKTPRIQASIGFGRMRAKAAFDYQAFAFGDIEDFDFLMYNVREKYKQADRLVAILDCGKAYVFCTSTSPAQALSLYQAVDRLIQEKQTAFSQSLKEIEKHIRRESLITTRKSTAQPRSNEGMKLQDLAPITLHTDVVVTLGNICVGAYPGTFFDSQIFKAEANNLQARFAVGIEQNKIRSGLGMTIGQLQVALAAVKKVPTSRSINDLSVDEIITGAVDSRGGVILKVPRVVASMETWQLPKSAQIEYIFKSLFEGKVDIGWNLSRINLIRGMWNTHSRALAQRMGKPLPESAVRITADLHEKKNGSPNSTTPQNKITAEVNLPQSRYEYIALEPAIIETPQLRDMGEATPPLEWIGLNRDRLPNITHQIIIVALIEIAKEVEDAYERILGTA